MARILAPSDLWDAQTTADYLQISKRTLYCWKWANKGPKARKLHGSLYYIPAEVRNWARIQIGI